MRSLSLRFTFFHGSDTTLLSYRHVPACMTVLRKRAQSRSVVANGPTVERTPSVPGTCILTTSATTRRERDVPRIECPAKDMIVTVSGHDGLRNIGLAVKDGAKVEKHRSNSTMIPCRLIDITSQASRRIMSLDCKSILERHGQAKEWWKYLGVHTGESLSVELASTFNGFVEEYFRQTVHL
ncbi:hypothetical protein MKX07_006642 [Trichoderma sp. CBMAI-0711]|nr:hypothetical protein MKX07_006642 [Trichoderma sp. CBMAI-0711]